MDFKARGSLIVGFTGKSGSGKTFVSTPTTNKVFSFATRLKEVAKLMGWDGKKDERGRRFLQHLGDVGREYDPEIWVKLLSRDLHDEIMEDAYHGFMMIYGIDDVRFDNEADFIHEHGGIVIELQHDKIQLSGAASKHKSENGLSKSKIDYSIPWGNLEVVRNKARKIIKEVNDRK